MISVESLSKAGGRSEESTCERLLPNFTFNCVTCARYHIVSKAHSPRNGITFQTKRLAAVNNGAEQLNIHQFANYRQSSAQHPAGGHTSMAQPASRWLIEFEWKLLMKKFNWFFNDGFFGTVINRGSVNFEKFITVLRELPKLPLPIGCRSNAGRLQREKQLTLWIIGKLRSFVGKWISNEFPLEMTPTVWHYSIITKYFR